MADLNNSPNSYVPAEDEVPEILPSINLRYEDWQEEEIGEINDENLEQIQPEEENLNTILCSDTEYVDESVVYVFDESVVEIDLAESLFIIPDQFSEDIMDPNVVVQFSSSENIDAIVPEVLTSNVASDNLVVNTRKSELLVNSANVGDNVAETEENILHVHPEGTPKEGLIPGMRKDLLYGDEAIVNRDESDYEPMTPPYIHQISAPVVTASPNMLPSILNRKIQKSPADKEMSPKQTVLNKDQIKKRLQSFSLLKQGIQPVSIKKIVKQPKIQVQIGEAFDEDGKKVDEKVFIVKKPPKQGSSPLDKAKAVIDEIEKIKRDEAAKIENTFYLKHSYFKRSPSSRERIVAENKIKDEKRHVKKRTKDKGSKSSDKVRKKRSEKSKEEAVPEDWAQVKEKHLDFKKISKLKDKMLKTVDKRNDLCKRSEENDKKIDIAASSLLQPPIVALTADGAKKYYPAEIVRFTEKQPSVMYCENPLRARAYFKSRKEILSEVSKERSHIMNQIIEAKTKTDSEDSSALTREWYPPKEFLNESKTNILPTKCNILLAAPVISYGLSVLSENYNDLEENPESLEEHLRKEKTATVTKQEEIEESAKELAVDHKSSKKKELHKSEKTENKTKSKKKSKEKSCLQKHKQKKSEDKFHGSEEDEFNIGPLEANSVEDKTPDTEEYRSNWESDEDILTEIMGASKPYSRSLSLERKWQSEDVHRHDDKGLKEKQKKPSEREDKSKRKNNETKRRKSKPDILLNETLLGLDDKRHSRRSHKVEHKRLSETKQSVDYHLPINKWSSEEEIHKHDSKSKRRDSKSEKDKGDKSKNVKTVINYRNSQWSSEDEHDKRSKHSRDEKGQKYEKEKQKKRKNRWDSPEELVKQSKSLIEEELKTLESAKKALKEKYEAELKSMFHNKASYEDVFDTEQTQSYSKYQEDKSDRESRDNSKSQKYSKNKSESTKKRSKNKKRKDEPKVVINYSDIEEDFDVECEKEQENIEALELFKKSEILKCKPKIKIDYSDFDMSLIQSTDKYNKKFEENGADKQLETPKSPEIDEPVINKCVEIKELKKKEKLLIEKKQIACEVTSSLNTAAVKATPVGPPLLPTTAAKLEGTSEKLASEYEEFMKAVCFDKDSAEVDEETATETTLKMNKDEQTRSSDKTDNLEESSSDEDSSEAEQSVTSIESSELKTDMEIKLEVFSDTENKNDMFREKEKRKRSEKSDSEDGLNPDMVVKIEKVSSKRSKKDVKYFDYDSSKFNNVIDWETSYSDTNTYCETYSMYDSKILPEDIPLPSDQQEPVKPSSPEFQQDYQRVTPSKDQGLVSSSEVLQTPDATPKDDFDLNSAKLQQWNLSITPTKRLLLKSRLVGDDSDEDFTDKFVKQSDKKQGDIETKEESKEPKKSIKSESVSDKVKCDKEVDKNKKPEKTEKHHEKSQINYDKKSDAHKQTKTEKRPSRTSGHEKRSRTQESSEERRERSRERYSSRDDRSKRRKLSDRKLLDRKPLSRGKSRHSKEREIRGIRSRNRSKLRNLDRGRERDRSLKSHHRDEFRRFSRSPSPHRRDWYDAFPTHRTLDDTDFSATSMDVVHSPTNSPLDGFKRSLADSTISDSELIGHLNTPDESNEPSPGNQRKYFPSVSEAQPAKVNSPSSPKRISLDDRINLVLGIEKEEPQLIDTVCSRGNYNAQSITPQYDAYAYYRSEYDMYNAAPTDNYCSSQYPNQYQQPPPYYQTQAPPDNSVKVMQVGNVIQVVPTELPAAPPPPPPQKINEIQPKAVQVGNVLQIVPMTMEIASTLSTSTTVASAPEVTHKTVEQLLAERRAEKEKRRQEREQRRKEKEKKRKEKEMRKQLKMKMKTENMIKRALLEAEEGDLDMSRLEEEIANDNLGEDVNLVQAWPPPSTITVQSLPKPPARGILIFRDSTKEKDEMVSEENLETRKVVKFADGIYPGEGTSPSGGEDLPSPPPPSRKLYKEKLYKEKRYKKMMIKNKKKIKVKIIRTQQPPAPDEEDDSEDNLPPPPPPPGSPPSHLWPARIKQPPVNNIHPQLPSSVYPPNPYPAPPHPPTSHSHPPPPLSHPPPPHSHPLPQHSLPPPPHAHPPPPVIYPPPYPNVPPQQMPVVVGHVPPPPPPAPRHHLPGPPHSAAPPPPPHLPHHGPPFHH